MKKCLIILLLLLTSPVIFSASVVETTAITQGVLSSNQNFIGTVNFIQSSVLASKRQGLVLQVNFDTTQSVSKGALLVELDHEILDSKITAIKASLKELDLQLEKATKDLKRYQQLLKQKSVSQQKYDEVYYDKIGLQQKYLAQRAALDSLTIERNQSFIKAPFDGVISKREVEVGEWVGEGGTIATLINPQRVEVLFSIPASFAMKMKKGATVEVTIAGKRYSGKVEGIILEGDNKSRTFPLKISLNTNDGFLLAGMEAQISLQNELREDTLLVPRDAVINRFGHDVVFVNDNSAAKMFPVKVLLYKGSMAAIQAEELKPGMKVVTKGNERLFPNQALSP